MKYINFKNSEKTKTIPSSGIFLSSHGRSTEIHTHWPLD